MTRVICEYDTLCLESSLTNKPLEMRYWPGQLGALPPALDGIIADIVPRGTNRFSSFETKYVPRLVGGSTGS